MQSRMKRCFSLHANNTNPNARALLLGDVDSQRAEVTGEIQLHSADAATFLESQPAGSLTGFSLSNIFDGANLAYQRRLRSAVQHAAAPGALVVLRSFSEPQIATPTNHATKDRSMLWGIVDIRPAEGLSQCWPT